MRRLAGRSWVGAVILALLVGAWPAAARAATPKVVRGGSVTWALISQQPNFDVLGPGPASTTEYPEFTGIYSRLVELDGKTGKVVPRLATSVTPNKDSTVWTIKIRSDVKFSDGTVFDANAVKADWDRLANPANAATIRSTLATFTSWVVQDPTTFVVTLPKPRGSFTTLLGTGPLSTIPSPTAVAKYGKSFGSSPDTTVGAGPFLLKEYVRNDHAAFVKNPNYFEKGKPYLDGFTTRLIADQNTQADALLTKTVDLGFTGTPNAATKRMFDAGLQYTTGLSSLSAGGIFNVSRAPFDDLRVRQAFTLATDPVDANLKATAGVAPNAGGKGSAYYPKTSPLYDKSVHQTTNDLVAAQKLIDAYVAEKGPISTTVLVPATLADLGAALVQQWSRLKNVHLEINSQANTATVLLTASGNYTAAVLGLAAYDYVDTAFSALGTGQAGNIQRYSSPKMDALLNEGFGYADVAHRKTYLNKIAQLIFDDALEVRVYFITFHMWAQKGIGGVQNTMSPQAFPDIATLQAKKQ